LSPEAMARLSCLTASSWAVAEPAVNIDWTDVIALILLH
jgi:hypothetical protein